MPQPKLHWSAYLWPGLPHLWVRGSWVGLALAVGFTALANVLLATCLVWSEWLPARVRWIGLAALAALWLLAWAEARANWRRWLLQWSADGNGLNGPEQDEQILAEAQQSYLAGDWVVAEQALRKLLRGEPRDVEAQLMLATMWRHQGRWPEADDYLGKLERAEASFAWKFEIARERELLQQAKESSSQYKQTQDKQTQGMQTQDDAEGVTNHRDLGVREDSEPEASQQHDAREERIHNTAEEPAWKRAA